MPYRVLVLATLCLISGCNLIGAVGSRVIPPPDIKARYSPEPDPLVVVAENWRNPAGAWINSEQLARFVYKDLRQRQVGTLIDPVTVLDLKSQRPADYRSLSIAQIGRLVGAKQVLYINITESGLSGAIGSESLQGRCTARVKVIDVVTGEARWPTDMAEGYPIHVETPVVGVQSQADEERLQRALQQATAVTIAQLFYTRAGE